MSGYMKALLAILIMQISSPSAWGKNLPSRDITKTSHNLSVSGGGGEHDIKSGREARICIFCHTPHHAGAQPLWSRQPSSLTVYLPYESATFSSVPQQPSGPSRLCLSCHDGTIAVGLLAGGTNLDTSLPVMPTDSDPRKNPNLGTDLSDDHPISMDYQSDTGELNDPATLAGTGVKLSNALSVECTSCHDPHNNENDHFLVRNVGARHDALCTTCHAKQGWMDAGTVHRTGGSRYADLQGQVSAEGCMNCHRAHTAERGEHLLRLVGPGEGEESNCISFCHQAPPYRDIRSEFTLPYVHPLDLSRHAHKGNEQLPLAQNKRHVECVDCHNPHQSAWDGASLDSTLRQAGTAEAPHASGPLRGSRGVDLNGNAQVNLAQYEFEICFRCHAGNSASSFVASTLLIPLRFFQQFDESQRFSPANPSFHPVTADRKGTGRSLLSSLQSTMRRIYCIDCHSPHGSVEPHLLRAQNADTVPSPVDLYPLCFRCHDSAFLLSPSSLPRSDTAELHRSHVLGPHLNGAAGRASCSACHDPHGVPALVGANETNGAHLINFDRRFAGASAQYNSIMRSCTVACHPTNPRMY